MSEPYRKKLIEVALPLQAISTASRREKDKKTGTIRNTHKWFAPMPGPALRALLFAALVDDPGDEAARDQLLNTVAALVPEGGAPPAAAALEEAKRLIRSAVELPTVLDPFCGGGSTLVEAQRLGIPAVGSDLNPVPVLIARVLTELVPRVAGKGPIAATHAVGAGGQYEGLLADVHHYAERVRDRVLGEIGQLYPDPPGRGKAVAWLWARTFTCPNPACGARAPLVSSFWLTKRTGAHAWIEPFPLDDLSGVDFKVVSGAAGSPPSGTVARTSATCLVCGSQSRLEHVRQEARRDGLRVQLMAIAQDDRSGRSYLPPSAEHSVVADVPRPAHLSDLPIPDGALGVRVTLYGMSRYSDIFTNRQLVALASFADAVADVPRWVDADGGDEDYASAVASVLGLAVGKLAQANSTQVRWNVRSTVFLVTQLQPRYTNEMRGRQQHS